MIFLTNCHSKTKAIVSADEVFEIVNDSLKATEYLVLDARKRMDYIRGHILPAQWIQSDSLEDKLDRLPKNARIIIYDSDNDASVKAADILRGNGFTKCSAMQGGYTAWNKKGFPSAIKLVLNTNPTLDITSKNISTDDLNKIVSVNDLNYAVIDIRPYAAFLEAHIKGAKSIPYLPINEFVVNIEAQNFSRQKPLILYTGENFSYADKAADVMLRNGYREIYLLPGGIEEWQSKGYPTE